MAVISITRFQTGSTDAEEVQARHADLVSAVRATQPGLAEARLGRLDDGTWVGVWRWDSAARLQAARQAAHDMSAATAAFEVVRDATVEDIEILADL
ncbi:antibiotic biosynthesis monooxygenase [Nonomuraea jiangxiensis]|uniref:Antibiotic biosynthesis monooxygenase n=1 Tax=Nonomuraea jiangxiensis TaxID=633440 RepID=A0A1G9IDT3_9ACTN|nr:antibiotic biosynthesis monooxygenase [Nonomuraea jiangxiensis]SDL23390.1 Antibiotic biosynthesis monooxygenase [Nonomuraea jiangxiensis]